MAFNSSNTHFPCCKNCTPSKRFIGCHGSCLEYESYKKIFDKKKNKINKIREKEKDINSFLYGTNIRHKR